MVMNSSRKKTKEDEKHAETACSQAGRGKAIQQRLAGVEDDAVLRTTFPPLIAWETDDDGEEEQEECPAREKGPVIASGDGGSKGSWVMAVCFAFWCSVESRREQPSSGCRWREDGGGRGRREEDEDEEKEEEEEEEEGEEETTAMKR
ncbi:hypothetical protein HL42_0334 [Trichophyton rubrum]|nr:hypothetical protein HL42_0334 [Trichophyton rubrum]